MKKSKASGGVITLIMAWLMTSNAQAALPYSTCLSLSQGAVQMNEQLPMTVGRDQAASTGVIYATTYTRVEVNCDKEEVVFHLRMADDDMPDSISKSQMALEVEQYSRPQICREMGFVRRWGVNDTRNISTQDGDAWHSFTVTPEDCGRSSSYYR